MIPCGKRFMVEAAVRGLSPGGEIIWFRGNGLGFMVYGGGAWTSGGAGCLPAAPTATRCGGLRFQIFGGEVGDAGELPLAPTATRCGDGEMVENKCVFTNKLLSLPNSTFSGLKVGLYGGCLMANRRMHRGASLQFGLDCRCHVKDYLNE